MGVRVNWPNVRQMSRDDLEREVRRLRAAAAVLAERERELLELKGKCSHCRLHYAHSGPCALRDGDRG
jgi:hypothetical protein